MKKKTILKEATVRRFWKLANVGAINEMGYQFGDELNEEEEEIEEVAGGKDKQDKDKKEVDETMKGRREDDEVDETMKGRREDKEEVDEDMSGMRDDAEAMDADEPAVDAPGDDDVDAEVSVPESDVEALRTARDVIDQILSAADGGDEPMGDEPMGDEPMGDDDPMDDEEPMMEEEEIDEDKLEEMVSAIADRVKARLVKEALLNRVKK